LVAKGEARRVGEKKQDRKRNGRSLKRGIIRERGSQTGRTRADE